MGLHLIAMSKCVDVRIVHINFDLDDAIVKDRLNIPPMFKISTMSDISCKKFNDFKNSTLEAVSFTKRSGIFDYRLFVENCVFYLFRLVIQHEHLTSSLSSLYMQSDVSPLRKN